MLDLLCKSRRSNVFFYQKGKKKNQFAFSTVRSSAVQMRYRTFKAGCSPDGIEPRNNGSRGVWSDRWALGPASSDEERQTRGTWQRGAGRVTACSIGCEMLCTRNPKTGCRALPHAPPGTIEGFQCNYKKKTPPPLLSHPTLNQQSVKT